MQRWFSKIVLHPILSKDNELREFIESDFGVRFREWVEFACDMRKWDKYRIPPMYVGG